MHAQSIIGHALDLVSVKNASLNTLLEQDICWRSPLRDVASCSRASE